MTLGFVSAILNDLSFEEVVDLAAANGFSCIEMMCWPVGKAERRYAGVTHVDVSDMSEERIKIINSYLALKSISVAALGYYPNPLDPDDEKRNFFISHIMKVIRAANLLGIKLVSTFVGRDKNKTVDENLAMFKDVWTPVIKYAEEMNVKVAIENCPMLFTNDEWPGGLNLAATPAIWRRMFELIPSPNLGLTYDPSHFVWQQIDYIKPIYEFRDRIYLVHFKDIKLYRDRLDQVGIMATPLEYMAPKIPGLGDVNWGTFVSALTDIQYNGPACIEVEDKAFEASLASRKKSLLLSRNHLAQFVL